MMEDTDDLKPENIDGHLNAYTLEYWTDGNVLIDEDDQEMVDTSLVGIFTTFDAALAIARKYPTYGDPGPSWHWVITRRRLNADEPSEIGGPLMDMWHLGRDLEPCKADGTPTFPKTDTRLSDLESHIKRLEARIQDLENAHAQIGA